MSEHALTPPTKVIRSPPCTPTSKRRQRAVNGSSAGQTPSSPSNTPRCKGVSLTTGLACKRPVSSDSYCYQHRGQLHTESIFGIPTTPPKVIKNHQYENVFVSSSSSSSLEKSINKREEFDDFLRHFNRLSIVETKEKSKTPPPFNSEPISKLIAPNSIQTPPPTSSNVIQTPPPTSSNVLKPIEIAQKSLYPHLDEQHENTENFMCSDASLNKKSQSLVHVKSRSGTSGPLNYMQHGARIHINLNSPNDDDTSFRQSPGSVRCQGRSLRTGKLCTRSIKVIKDEDNTKIWYCHQHRVEIEKNQPSIESLTFVPDWIDSNLKEETKKMLLEEMSKPISSKDESGYIYAYELIDGPLSKNFDSRLYKVGRATNVHRRLYQWNRQCGYEPSVIEYFPENKELGQLITVPVTKCKYTHRAERLIHIELGDKFHTILPKCPGCGNQHREFFKVPILNSDDGWDKIRRGIIHWLTYIEKIYGVGY
ncbi:3060_t:CDS:2 [Ambispora gerdemannii]|uniref:3060_t:CDS:1 n=1 Tax=Ambispora gerdemannii TaxID=144530 RepID=A0A9N8VDZ5_9GLOM|nr:3060_t:CDS:2 [Ambispora gerdemannii]